MAVTGVALPDAYAKAKPTVAGVAELIWGVRRLTCSRLQAVRNLVAYMQRWLLTWVHQAGSGGADPVSLTQPSTRSRLVAGGNLPGRVASGTFGIQTLRRLEQVLRQL